MVKLAFEMYSGARWVSFQGAVSDAGHATIGIVAGCVYATLLIQGYAGPPLGRCKVRFPRTKLAVYIDDFGLEWLISKGPLQILEAGPQGEPHKTQKTL